MFYICISNSLCNFESNGQYLRQHLRVTKEKEKVEKRIPLFEGCLKLKDMDKGLELLEEYKTLAGHSDEKSEMRKSEILEYVKEHNAEFPKDEVAASFKVWLGDVSKQVDAVKEKVLRDEMSSEMYKLLPLKYIANTYFGKSVSWLSQRLNGTKVRGKSYTLNESQKQTFNNAMLDLSKKFGSFRLA